MDFPKAHPDPPSSSQDVERRAELICVEELLFDTQATALGGGERFGVIERSGHQHQPDSSEDDDSERDVREKGWRYVPDEPS
jgi:hypothetical protein